MTPSINIISARSMFVAGQPAEIAAAFGEGPGQGNPLFKKESSSNN